MREKQEIRMTLARALRYKKRLLHKIANIQSDINTSNSVIVPAEDTEVKREVDIRSLLEQREVLLKHLVDLKIIFYEKNKPIQRAILELAELKGEISFWESIKTQHGPLMYEYADNPIIFNAFIRKEEVDKKVGEFTKKIDELQEKIDAHNYNTEIVVEDHGVI